MSILSVSAQSTNAPTTNAAPSASAPAANLPAPDPEISAVKLDKEGKPNESFLRTHARYVAVAHEGKGQLVFLGDSITAGWIHKDIWTKSFAAYQPVNFGIGGDGTQNVLWRIDNGTLDGLHPKVLVLLIGTNNGGQPAEKIAGGITKIVEEVRAKLPDTKILLLGVFPRGLPTDPVRANLKHVNEIIAKLDDQKHVFFLDIGDKFLQPDGTISRDVMPDLLHPSIKGYEIWAGAMGPELAKLMN